MTWRILLVSDQEENQASERRAVSDVTRKLVRCVISFSLVQICALALLTEPIQMKCFVI